MSKILAHSHTHTHTHTQSFGCCWVEFDVQRCSQKPQTGPELASKSLYHSLSERLRKHRLWTIHEEKDQNLKPLLLSSKSEHKLPAKSEDPVCTFPTKCFPRSEPQCSTCCKLHHIIFNTPFPPSLVSCRCSTQIGKLTKSSWPTWPSHLCRWPSTALGAPFQLAMTRSVCLSVCQSVCLSVCRMVVRSVTLHPCLVYYSRTYEYANLPRLHSVTPARASWSIQLNSNHG